MYQTAKHSFDSLRGETYIGFGLIILIAGVLWPVAPFVTAMAILSLGATEITIARFRGKASFLPVLVLHGAAYAGLYALFIGATLHAAAISSQPALPRWTAADLLLSLVPFTAAMQRIANCLRQLILSRP